MIRFKELFVEELTEEEEEQEDQTITEEIDSLLSEKDYSEHTQKKLNNLAAKLVMKKARIKQLQKKYENETNPTKKVKLKSKIEGKNWKLKIWQDKLKDIKKS